MKVVRKYILKLWLIYKTRDSEALWRYAFATTCFSGSVGCVGLIFYEGFSGISLFGILSFALLSFLLFFQEQLEELRERRKRNGIKPIGSDLKNPFDKLISVKLGRWTYIHGFAWRFGILLYSMVAMLVHPILVLIVFAVTGEEFKDPHSFFGLYSIGILFGSMIISCWVFGYGTVIGPRSFTVYYSILFVPVYGLRCSLEKVHFNGYSDSSEEDSDVKQLACIHKDSDPWAEMGFEDWVQINYGKKKLDIGDNENYEELYDKILAAVEKNTDFGKHNQDSCYSLV